jgi:hypothetical protein
MISSQEQLDDILSQPSEADRRAMAELPGDLLILGVAGKMGPSLARRARRACDEAAVKKRILGVARFSDRSSERMLRDWGIETMGLDLMSPGALDRLPDVENVLYMAARKFGSTGAEHLTWGMNTFLPGLVANRFRASRSVAFSPGNIYPLVPVTRRPTETDPVGPVVEYAQSALGREHIFRIFLVGERHTRRPAPAELRHRTAVTACCSMSGRKSLTGCRSI